MSTAAGRGIVLLASAIAGALLADRLAASLPLTLAGCLAGAVLIGLSALLAEWAGAWLRPQVGGPRLSPGAASRMQLTLTLALTGLGLALPVLGGWRWPLLLGLTLAWAIAVCCSPYWKPTSSHHARLFVLSFALCLAGAGPDWGEVWLLPGAALGFYMLIAAVAARNPEELPEGALAMLLALDVLGILVLALTVRQHDVAALFAASIPAVLVMVALHAGADAWLLRARTARASTFEAKERELPAIGWKAFRVLSEECALSPISGRGGRWRSPQIKASCVYRHQAPSLHCECGLYAAHLLWPLCSWGAHLQPCGDCICALVSGYGEVIEHKEGWRAESITVLGVLDRGEGDQAAHAWARELGVPCGSRAQLELLAWEHGAPLAKPPAGPAGLLIALLAGWRRQG